MIRGVILLTRGFTQKHKTCTIRESSFPFFVTSDVNVSSHYKINLFLSFLLKYFDTELGAVPTHTLGVADELDHLCQAPGNL